MAATTHPFSDTEIKPIAEVQLEFEEEKVELLSLSQPERVPDEIASGSRTLSGHESVDDSTLLVEEQFENLEIVEKKVSRTATVTTTTSESLNKTFTIRPLPGIKEEPAEI